MSSYKYKPCIPIEEAWEDHDWAFHKKSRAMGFKNPATYRFKNTKSKPTCEDYPRFTADDLIALPRPDTRSLKESSLSFVRVLETRASKRSYFGESPINIHDLASFLYLSCRSDDHYTDDDGEDLEFRPYPSAGAIHELNTYVVVKVCHGLAPGLYAYFDRIHKLGRVDCDWPQIQNHITHAEEATGLYPGAQVILLVTTDLAALSWKYEGIAYSLTLKNLGCLFQTWYLVATALNLAPCAIGCGDSENFARATGIPERQEALIGEFALGSKP